jgi:hypothetical protein
MCNVNDEILRQAKILILVFEDDIATDTQQA